MTTDKHPKPTAESLAIVKATRRKDGSYSSGGVGRFRSPELAAVTMDNRQRLRAHVDKAGSDPTARAAALLAYFGLKGDA